MDRWVTDTEPSRTYPIYSRANAGEVMPDPMSPLTVDLCWHETGEPGWRDALVEIGVLDARECEPHGPTVTGYFGGYLYINMSVTRLFGVRTPGLTPEMVDLQYFGEMPGIPGYLEERRPTDESPEHTEKLGRWLAGIVAVDEQPQLRDERDAVLAVVNSRPDLKAVEDSALVERALSLLPLWRTLFSHHILQGTSAGVPMGVVHQVCGSVGRPDLVTTLFGGVGEVDSALPSWEMWKLGRIVAESARLMTAFDGGFRGLMDRLGSSDDSDVVAFLERFDNFLGRYGFRGPNEWELRSHTWRTNPELALAAIDRLRFAPESAAPAANHKRVVAEREDAERTVLGLLGEDGDAAATFSAALRAAALYGAGRERTKTSCVLLVHEARLALRELGSRAARSGHLASPEQVFMLRRAELHSFVADPGAWSSTLADRERGYLELRHLEPPFVVYQQPPPLGRWRRRTRTATQVGAGAQLTGIAGSAGRATGRARIVLDPSDPGALEPGDVLVAPLTDPAWTPLFMPAAAVVVDVGAQITHAIIVSRELGVPCVVSVTDATRKIPDGAIVTVDGSLGTVTVEAVPE
jgi:pyruvate,water dikinase